MTYLKVVFSFLFIIFLVSCEAGSEPVDIEYSLSHNSLSIEVYSDSSNLYDDIYITTSTDEEISCVIDDSSILYDTLGEYIATCTYNISAGTDSIAFTVNIVDTTPPVILTDVVEIISTMIPSIDDLIELVTITDNYDDSFYLNIDDSEVDKTTPGSYTLTLYVEDSSGNRCEKEITLTIYNLEIPTYVLSTEGITETSFIISYDVSDNVDLEDTTFIKMEIKVYDNDILIDTKESTDPDDYLKFSTMLSNHEYEVEVIIYYDLNKGDGEETVSTTQTVNTLTYTNPTFNIGTTFTKGNSVTMYYTYSDIDLIIETMTLNLYDEDNSLYSSVLLDKMSTHIVVESTEYDSEFRVEVVVDYDALDGNGSTSIIYPGNTVYTAVLAIDEIIVTDNIIDEVQDYTFELVLEHPVGYTIENIFIDDVIVGYTYENNKHLVTIPSSSILEGETTYEITKIVVNNGSATVDVIPEDNNELIIILEIPLSISGITVNNGVSYMGPLSNYQIKLSLENYSTYEIQSVIIDGVELTSSSFTIINDELIITKESINTFGGFRLSIEEITYLNGSELVTLDINYIDYLYAGDIYNINYISNRSDFLSMGSSGIYILQTDIDLTDTYYLQYLSDFDGCLDGNGYSISGLDLVADSPNNDNLGLFGTLGSHSLIKNLTLYDMSISSTEANTSSNPLNVGIIAGISSGKFYNVSIESSSIEIYDSSIRLIQSGSIVGLSFNGTFELIDVNMSNNITSEYKVYAGGITGHSLNTIISRAFTLGDLSVEVYLYSYIGGITGYVEGSSTIYNEVASTLNFNVLVHANSEVFIGGINGLQMAGSTSNMYYIGTLDIMGVANKLYLGGINGYTASSSLTNAYVTATFDLGETPSTAYAGNITGVLESSTVTNTLTDTIYIGQLNDPSSSITISDITGLISSSTTTNIHLLELDLTSIIGSDYTSLQNISNIIDSNTFDKFTFYEDTLLFDSTIWDLEYTESSTILQLLNIND